ncbi:MAG: hypothetical protein QGD94_08850, partial [Planctomycetia bacterium]|nr:hypothetical protein [Planctomycetia bacterium]
WPASQARSPAPGQPSGKRRVVSVSGRCAACSSAAVGSVSAAGWPESDEEACREDVAEYRAQVNGKLRERFSIDADAAEEEVRSAAMELPKVKSAIGNAKVRKVIVVKGRLVSIVAK